MTNRQILAHLKNNLPQDAAHLQEIVTSLGNNPTLSPGVSSDDYESAATFLYGLAVSLGDGESEDNASLSILRIAGKLMREALSLRAN
jgi:hypothetical protein